MSLRDQINADSLNVFLNTSDFGESVLFYPKRGSVETITAVVFETIDYSDQTGVIEKKSVLLIQVKDGAIDPQPGDQCRRSSDSIESRWTFDGDIEPMEGINSYRFVRVLPAQWGGAHFGSQL